MDSLNISGVLVMAQPARMAAVQRALARCAGVEIHSTSPDGRIVITIDGTAATGSIHPLIRIQRIPGVLAANLVYHHAEPAEEMEHEAIEA